MKARYTSLLAILFCSLPLWIYAEVDVVVVNDENLVEEVDECKLPIVIDAYADWCGPCRSMGPEFKAAAQDYDEVVKFCKYDVDVNSELGHRHHIQSLPTLLFYKDGKLVKKVVGYRKADEIRKLVDQIFKDDIEA